MNKIVNIIKPTGMTSHDVVSAVRKILNTKKPQFVEHIAVCQHSNKLVAGAGFEPTTFGL